MNTSTKLRYAERRTLELLLEKPHDRFSLGNKIKSGYAPNQIKRLRHTFKQEIETIKETYKRKDGKLSWIGVYHLRDSEKAIKALMEY